MLHDARQIQWHGSGISRTVPEPEHPIQSFGNVATDRLAHARKGIYGSGDRGVKAKPRDFSNPMPRFADPAKTGDPYSKRQAHGISSSPKRSSDEYNGNNTNSKLGRDSAWWDSFDRSCRFDHIEARPLKYVLIGIVSMWALYAVCWAVRAIF